MEFEWDPAKRLANLAKHGLDFEDVLEFDWANAAIQMDGRKDYGEVRFRAWGMFGGRMHSVAFTRKGRTLRIISFRKANSTEVKRYGP
ncbi:MAG TPA: BrnT family toxin [Rhizomicrobium sp.]|nr:BrnT family toxin [Rhizomicrobium sp.]